MHTTQTRVSLDELMQDEGYQWHTKGTRGHTLARVVSDRNPMLKGWFMYFKHAHGCTFKRLAGA